MTTVRQLLKVKGGQVWSVTPETTIQASLKVMAEKHIGAVVVALDNQHVQGIFSERDLAREVGEKGQVDVNKPIKTLMTEMVYYVTPDNTIEDCMALMTQKRIRHLPVVDAEGLRGIISIGDVVKLLVEDKDVTIRSLENFILGREMGS